MADKIGKKFEDFIILKVINRGKYGYVAKVKSKLDNNIYAMKRIDLNSIKLNTLQEYYKNEYDIISSLDHENVYRALSKFKEGNVLYIITEYMDGGNLQDLFDWYKENGIHIDEKRLLNIFVQCLKGLKYIHEKGIIHRSIKHDNIIFDSNDKIKIINFKYSIKKEKNDKEKIDIGRLMAPEMKEKDYDEKVDVYPMGMIFSSLAYLSSKTSPTSKGIYSPRLNSNIEKMKKTKKDRPSSSEIYLDFINMYYDAIRSCLKCFIFYFVSDDFKEQKDELIKLEGKGMEDTSITKKIIELSKIDEFKSEETISLIETFSENGFDISKINPKEFTDIILNEMNEKIQSNKYEFEKIESGDLNEIKKKNFENNYKRFIENNKTLISEKFLVSYIKTEKCKNCINEKKNEYYLYDQGFYINIDKEILDKAIKKFNNEPNNKENGIIKYVFNALNERRTEEIRICRNCKKKIRHILSTKFYELQKYLIFLCEPEIEFRDEDKKHLFEFKIGKEEVDCFENDGTYTYKLISIIIKSKDGYDYYNRKLDEKMFSKNDGDIKDKGEEVYSLKEMSGNPVALYYYSDRKKIENDNITLPTDKNSMNNYYPYPIKSEQYSFTSTIIITNNNESGNNIEVKNEIVKERNISPNLTNNNINNNINNNSLQNVNNQNNRQNQKNARDKIINNSNENVYQKNEDEQKKIDNNSTSYNREECGEN